MNDDNRAGLTTKIPMTFRRRAGKAVIVLPNGARRSSQSVILLILVGICISRRP